MALARSQAESCATLVELAKASKVRLIIPAYCFVEPHDALIRRFKSRRELSQRVQAELRELSRSTHYQDLVAQQEAVVQKLLVESQEEESVRLHSTLSELLTVAVIVPLTGQALSMAAASANELSLPPQDSVILASVLQHLGENKPKEGLFLTANSKDFGDPDVLKKLEELHCRTMFSFKDGLGYVQSKLT